MIQVSISFIKNGKHLLLSTIGYLWVVITSAQPATLAPNELVDWIRKYHPIALQADLRIDQARASVRIARGGFDPVLENETAQKTWNGRMYYYYNRPELKLPTWFGMTVHAGQEFLAGNETSPTDTKGESNYLGVSLSLAKNLLMDKRRAALRTAQVLREASEVEKRIALNDLIKEGLNAYWEWVRASMQEEAIRKTWEANLQRRELIRTLVRAGDRPPIDTIEANTQVFHWEGQWAQAQLQVDTKRRDLSNFLWSAQEIPVELPAVVQPEEQAKKMEWSNGKDSELEELLKQLPNQNPALQLFPFRLQRLQIERKLQFQELLPDLRFQYNQLGSGYSWANTWKQPLFENNYQYGLKLAIPLRLSQGRGGYEQAKLNIRITNLEQDLRQRKLENEVRNLYQSCQTTRLQAGLLWEATQGFEQLLQTEVLRFKNGESALFLVNAREVRWMEAKLQWIQTRIRLCQQGVELDYQTGQLL